MSSWMRSRSCVGVHGAGAYRVSRLRAKAAPPATRSARRRRACSGSGRGDGTGAPARTRRVRRQQVSAPVGRPGHVPPANRRRPPRPARRALPRSAGPSSAPTPTRRSVPRAAGSRSTRRTRRLRPRHRAGHADLAVELLPQDHVRPRGGSPRAGDPCGSRGSCRRRSPSSNVPEQHVTDAWPALGVGRRERHRVRQRDGATRHRRTNAELAIGSGCSSARRSSRCSCEPCARIPSFPDIDPHVSDDRCAPAGAGWCPRQDSNLRTRLRRPALYPLSYGGERAPSLTFRPELTLTAYARGMPTVLLVDDDPAILRLLELNFRLEGFETMTASRGAEASRSPPSAAGCDRPGPDAPGDGRP